MRDPFDSVADTIQIRIANALTFLLNEQPSQYISVSKVCRIAEVSRANLYSSHRSLVDQIHSVNKERRAQQPTTVERARDEISAEVVKNLQKRVRTLAFLCVELQLKNDELLSRLAALEKSAKKK